MHIPVFLEKSEMRLWYRRTSDFIRTPAETKWKRGFYVCVMLGIVGIVSRPYGGHGNVMEEKALYSYWEHHLAGGPLLKTRDGRDVRVRSSGTRNPVSGPDYEHAVVEIDGETWSGPVELHVKERDWYRHGHEEDEMYDQVLLHVCFQSRITRGEGPVSDNRTIVLQASEECIKNRNVTRQGGADLQEPTTGFCSAGVLVDDPNRIQTTLDYLIQKGRRRMTRRQREMDNRYPDSISDNHVLLREILRSLCLFQNRKPGQLLAKGLPTMFFRSFFQQIPPPTHRTAGELYLFVRGNLPKQHQKRLYTGTSHLPVCYRNIRPLLEDRNLLPDPLLIQWNLSDVRPVNTPFRRLAGFISLLLRHRRGASGNMNLLRTYLDLLRPYFREESREPEPLIAPLMVSANDTESPWLSRSHPNKILDRPMGLIGKHRASVLFVNAVYPVLMLVFERREWSGMKKRLHEVGKTVPLPLSDHRTSGVQERLFGKADAVPTTPLIEQGLHELDRDLCRHAPSSCKRCDLRKMLSEEKRI